MQQQIFLALHEANLMNEIEQIQRLISQREERSTYRLGQRVRMLVYPIDWMKMPRTIRTIRTIHNIRVTRTNLPMPLTSC